jgi:hypothetical protein
VQLEGTWSKGHNHELYNLFNKLDITKYTKIKRLSWAGYIVRMENSRSCLMPGMKGLGKFEETN